jgi:N-acetylglucosamine-6-sulfatase
MRLFLPALLISALLAVLALLLENGRELGAGVATLTLTGRAYVAILMLGPLVILPLAWRSGASLRFRVAASLLPGFLWWLTEVWVRLRWHSLAESLWLVSSFFNLFHLWVTGIAIAIAELGCRLATRQAVRPWRVAGVTGGFMVAIGLAALSLFPYLFGYRAIFQSDLLPMPADLPGALDPATVAMPADRPPNIVFILSDDHRFDYAGYEGHPFIETPALDRLAAEGVNFTRAYVTSSLCSPSRASFLTGTYPHRHGVWNNFTPWSDDNQTFLEYLKPAGYRTAFIGKWHMPGNLPDLRGVDHFVTFTNAGGQGSYEWCPLVVDGVDEPSRVKYIAEELTNRALEWIERDPDEPFALYLSHKNVHADFAPDAPEAGRYAEAPAPLPDGAHPWTHLTNAQYTHFNFNPLDSAIRKYGEAITSMDRQIGRVLARLDELGLAEDTVVIYTSDNGYQWGERGLVDKRWPYEVSARVPFLVRWPGSDHPEGVRVDRIVGNIDVAPSFLSLAGVPVPDRMQGRSFLPLLEDPGAAWRESFLYSYYFEPPYPTPTAHALVTEDYKLIEYDGLPTELYDLWQDPTEQKDLADAPEATALRSRLERQLSALRAEVER